MAYLVSFRVDYQVIDSFSVNEGETIPTASIPTVSDELTPEGKEFDYWAENGTEFDFSTTITDDTVLDAVFKDATDDESTHTVTFVDLNGDTISEVEVEDGGTVAPEDIPTAPEIEDYRFKYWYIWVSSEDIEHFDSTTVITSDLEVNPYYVELFTVTYEEEDGEGETHIQERIVESGSKAENIAPINSKYIRDEEGMKIPYVFSYWAEEDDYAYNFNEPVEYNLTLYAKYVISGNKYWVMGRNNCLVGLYSNISYLPIANVETGTRAMALSEDGVKYYTFYKRDRTWYPDKAEE